MKFLIKFKFIGLSLVVLSLQSCFVAKDYEQPDIIEEENFRTDSIPQDSLTMANVSWRDMFTDPILQNHIEEGLQNNIDIRVALQQILYAESYLKQGKAGYFPSITLYKGFLSISNRENRRG